MTADNNYYHSVCIAKHADNKARSLTVATPHGSFQTPAFMPVATRAFMNLATPTAVADTGSQIILGGNTYHMLVKPGMDVIRSSGGMHSMMAWHQPMLTDSGGFQVFSLSKNSSICCIDESGARFKDPYSGKVIQLNPEASIATQKTIGADLVMAFDQCTPEIGGRAAAVSAMERTHRWLLRSIEAHQKQPMSDYGLRQALFGIIQGGRFKDLRVMSAAFVSEQALDGIAIGGETIGFDMDKTIEILDWITPYLAEHKVRYTMGVGATPRDLVRVVERGVDIFDCVAPTRNARHGSLYDVSLKVIDDWVEFVRNEKILIKKSQFAQDQAPIMDGCDCYTCQNFSRAYLHYIFKEKSNLYLNLATLHNIRVMQKSCELLRACIALSDQDR